MAIRFLPTEEQTMVRDSARRWVVQDHQAEGDAEAHWAHFAEMGWLMIALPEAAGGLGGDAYDAAIIAEELGRGIVRAPFVEVAVVAAQALLAIAPERVAAIASGDARPILAHDEAEARGDPAWVATRAVRHDGGWRLSGRKTGLVGAPLASGFLVSATIEGEGLALFDLPAEGAPLRAFRTVDDRPAGELRLADTPATLIAGPDRASAAILAAHDHALVLESAEAVGTMQAALDLTRDYLLTRKQYGQRIGDFQALRHRLADMFIELEQARSIVLRGLEALTAGDPTERARIAAATRARVAQAGSFVGAQGIQLHGGIGVTEEYPVGHYFKRLIAFSTRHGTAAAQVQRFAELCRME
ncbi:acyl-CoA dehydrogenase family protein [Flavisphingomonas formosensis]|uniref:acyl-CoA dehydrogenase family protein n=1 Tax=Flavisphingomonas formosensis TaxID=861534 RepID=UPI0012F969BC|nr:acyl-CoA dehydrogenase family protein [Sphingomonas formosensis]